MFFIVRAAIRLLLGVGKHKAKAVLVVAPNLATNMILDTAFIVKEIDRIETKSRQIVPNSEHVVAIVAPFEDENAVELVNGVTAGPAGTVRSCSADCRVAKQGRFRQEVKHQC